jgi:hypothetical protein
MYLWALQTEVAGWIASLIRDLRRAPLRALQRRPRSGEAGLEGGLFVGAGSWVRWW